MRPLHLLKKKYRVINSCFLNIVVSLKLLFICTTHLSNSYVSPSKGLNGLPTRSQFDAAADAAKAAMYYKLNKTFGI